MPGVKGGGGCESLAHREVLLGLQRVPIEHLLGCSRSVSAMEFLGNGEVGADHLARLAAVADLAERLAMLVFVCQAVGCGLLCVIVL